MYLKDAPIVDDVNDNEQCGDLREYFGYERNFPIDKKICDEVKEYKNTRDLGFMDVIIEEMEAAAANRPELEILELEIEELEIQTLEQETLDAEELEKLVLKEIPKFQPLKKPMRNKLGKAKTRK